MTTEVAGVELKTVNPMAESGIPLFSLQTAVGVAGAGVLIGGTVAVASVVWGRGEERVEDTLDALPSF